MLRVLRLVWVDGGGAGGGRVAAWVGHCGWSEVELTSERCVVQ